MFSFTFSFYYVVIGLVIANVFVFLGALSWLYFSIVRSSSWSIVKTYLLALLFQALTRGFLAAFGAAHYTDAEPGGGAIGNPGLAVVTFLLSLSSVLAYVVLFGQWASVFNTGTGGTFPYFSFPSPSFSACTRRGGESGLGGEDGGVRPVLVSSGSSSVAVSHTVGAGLLAGVLCLVQFASLFVVISSRSTAHARSDLQVATVIANAAVVLFVVVSLGVVVYMFRAYGDRIHGDDEGLLAQHYSRMLFFVALSYAVVLGMEMAPPSSWISDPAGIAAYYIFGTLTTVLHLLTVRSLPSARLSDTMFSILPTSDDGMLSL